MLRCLLALLLLLPLPATAQSSYQSVIDTWVAQDALDPPVHGALVVVGSSSIRFWQRVTRDFSHYDVIQRGFGGSQFSDLNQFVDDIVLPYEPAAVLVFEGTNDTAAGKSALTVFNDYLTFVNLVHSGQNQARPPIPIFFIGITPTPARWAIWPIQAEVNRLVEAHAAGDPALYYLPIPAPFLATGQPPSSSLFLPDGLHLNQAGYDIWTAVIRPIVEAAVPPTRQYVWDPSHPAVGARVLFDLGPNNPEDGAHTASPDPGGQHWNNWHALSGEQAILPGEHLGQLVSSTGALTPLHLTVTGSLNSNGILNGGLLTPDPALLGALAVGTATQDYFFTDAAQTPGGLQLTGLHPGLTFDLRIFATRATNETRISRYTVSGRTETSRILVTSGLGIGSTGGNGNDDTVLELRRVHPDRFGQLFIELEREAGSFAYLGILELVVRPPRRSAAPGPVLKP